MMTKYTISAIIVCLFLSYTGGQIASVEPNEVTVEVVNINPHESKISFRDSLDLLIDKSIRSKIKINKSKEVIEKNRGYEYNLDSIKRKQQ